MKKHFYPIFALFLVGVMFSCQSPKSNSTKEEAAGIDSMAPNPFIMHMLLSRDVRQIMLRKLQFRLYSFQVMK